MINALIKLGAPETEDERQKALIAYEKPNYFLAIGGGYLYIYEGAKHDWSREKQEMATGENTLKATDQDDLDAVIVALKKQAKIYQKNIHRKEEALQMMQVSLLWHDEFMTHISNEFVATDVSHISNSHITSEAALLVLKSGDNTRIATADSLFRSNQGLALLANKHQPNSWFLVNEINDFRTDIENDRAALGKTTAKLAQLSPLSVNISGMTPYQHLEGLFIGYGILMGVGMYEFGKDVYDGLTNREEVSDEKKKKYEK